MIYENEVIMLLLGVGVLIFILTSRLRLKQLPASNILTAAFYIALASWVSTVLEGLFLEGFFNYVEHICCAVGSILLAVWCRKAFSAKKETA
jgi:hypothetical protein